jgi:hypothetical protein
MLVSSTKEAEKVKEFGELWEVVDVNGRFLIAADMTLDEALVLRSRVDGLAEKLWRAAQMRAIRDEIKNALKTASTDNTSPRTADRAVGSAPTAATAERKTQRGSL